MRAGYAAVAAVALAAVAFAAAPVAAQAHSDDAAAARRARRAVESARFRFRTWTSGALRLAARLEQKKDSTADHMQADVNALGRELNDASRALSELQRAAADPEKARLDSVRTHLKLARAEYRKLAGAQPDPDEIAGHAAIVHQELLAARRAYTARAAPVRRSHRRPRRKSRR